MSQSSKSFRGMRDILPGELDRRTHFVSMIRSTYKSHGFTEIETPVVESLNVLLNSGGGENEKLTFRLLKRGERLDLQGAEGPGDLVDGGLRFDLTVPLCRFYAENSAKLPRPFRSIQIGNVFRAERPQKGRFRQFLQADIDIIGDPSPLAEIELLIASCHALHVIGLDGFEVHLNDRRALEQILSNLGVAPEEFSPILISLDKLDKVGPAAVISELADKGQPVARSERILEILSPGSASALGAMAAAGVESGVIESLRTIAGHLHDSIKGVNVKIDPLCIRGLGYYTSTVFEITHPKWGTSIAGGGRYDRMLSRFGVDAPACGVSLGFERIMGLLQEEGVSGSEGGKKLYLLFDPRSQIGEALVSAREYRRGGYQVVLVPHREGARSPMKRLATEAEELKSQGAHDEYWFVTVGEEQPPRLLMH